MLSRPARSAGSSAATAASAQIAAGTADIDPDRHAEVTDAVDLRVLLQQRHREQVPGTTPRTHPTSAGAATCAA